MNKLTLSAILSFSFTLAYCQQNVLVFKKRGKDINRYWEGSTIAFQSTDKQWQKGEITKIQNDSLYIRPMVVRYRLMGSDTVHYGVKVFALTDIFAMPNKGILIDYINGRFQISRTGGHVHWYWIKSGWIFRVGAAGYAGLNIANGLIKNNFSISDSKTQLLTAAAVFLGGVLLHKNYKPYLRIRKKYRLEIKSWRGLHQSSFIGNCLIGGQS
jgi:hypothetical protein